MGSVYLAVAVVAMASAASAEELPLGRIRLPPGFHIAVYAHPVKNARSLALGPDGIVFVGTRSAGNVYALVDEKGRHEDARVYTLAHGLTNPNGVAFRDGALYVAERSRILRYDDIAHHLDAPPAPVIIRDDYPDKAHHGWKFIAFGPDGWLYVPVGAPCNVCQSRDPIFATITRLSPDGKTRQIYARGVRNSVGFDWHPRTHELWFTDNGRDDMGDDVPPDELDRAPKSDLDFGFPYCHGRDIPDPKYGRDKPCRASVPPAADLGAHVAAVGMRFYNGTMFPASYRGDIFIVEHGSWNRSVPVGYRLVRIKLDGDRVAAQDVFAEGWLPPRPEAEDPHRPFTRRADESADVVRLLIPAKKSQAWGRPVDVLVMPDGALLVSDDMADAVYRISYTRTQE
jgi:glucose/arabinose dehydrogenase